MRCLTHDSSRSTRGIPWVPCVYDNWKATRGSSKQPSTFFVTVTVAEIGERFSSSSSVADECKRPDDERGERANPSRAARRAAAAGDRARRVLLDARNVPLDVGEELVVGAARRPARFTHPVSRREEERDHVLAAPTLDEWRPRCC